MKMVRLLIADDDDYTREGLVETLPWASLGISQVMQARDGLEAMRIAASERPEVVLTDIRMPRLNGIEFAERLVQLSPESQLLFMSGYMDVEYLKSAIRLAAVDFIEKPLKLPEVEAAIRKTLLQWQARKEQDAIKGEKIELQRRRLAELLLRGTEDCELIARLCRETSFPAEAYYLVLAMNRPVGGTMGQEELEQVLEFWTTHGFATAINSQAPEQIELIIAYDKQDRRRVQYLVSACAVECPGLVLGVGREVRGLEEVCSGGESARQAAALAFYMPEQRCFRYEDGEWAGDERQSSLLPEFYRLMHDERERLPEWIDELCDGFAARQSPLPERVKAVFTAFAEALVEDQASLRGEAHLGEPAVALRACGTLAEVRGYMRMLARRYLEDVSRTSCYSRLVQEVMRYVAQHYSRTELDLSGIAAQMHLSAAHLNVRFKQETGITIKQYIGDYRIGMARKLIENGHYRMQEIAELCGYASASYFAKAFKTATSLSPVEYKRRRDG